MENSNQKLYKCKQLERDEKMGQIFASIVMPTFNKKERLELSIESFEYQTIPPNSFELIIVDDGSSDGTEDMLKGMQRSFPLRYIKKKNEGRSAARNLGIEAARAKLIIFCDDDLIVAPTFVEEHIKAHEQGECVAHGTIYNLPYLKFFKNPSTGEIYQEFSKENLELVKQYCVQKETLRDILKIHKQSKLTLLEKTLQSIFKKNLYEFQWLCCSGANMSCEKDLLQKVGMFNLCFGKEWGAEDFELGFRLYQQKVKFVYLDNACNYHMMHARMNFKEALETSTHKFYECHPEENIYHLEKLLSGEIRDIDEYIHYVKTHKVNY